MFVSRAGTRDWLSVFLAAPRVGGRNMGGHEINHNKWGSIIKKDDDHCSKAQASCSLIKLQLLPHKCREEDGKDKHLAGAAVQGIKDKDQKIKSQPLISVT